MDSVLYWVCPDGREKDTDPDAVSSVSEEKRPPMALVTFNAASDSTLP